MVFFYYCAKGVKSAVRKDAVFNKLYVQSVEQTWVQLETDDTLYGIQGI